MGLKYSQDFVSITSTAVVVRSSAAGFDGVDIADYWHLKSRIRLDESSKSDSNPIIRINLTEAKSVEAVFLNDVNFDKARIFGHTTDLSTDWSGADYDSSNVDISLNQWTGRYQVIIDTSTFDRKWLAVAVPAAANAVGTYTTKWEVGSVVIMDSLTETSASIQFPLQQNVEQPVRDVGRHGRVSLNDTPGWTGRITFGTLEATNEGELRSLGRIDKASPTILYLNQGNTQECYLCLVDNSYESNWFSPNLVRQARQIQFREIISG